MSEHYDAFDFTHDGMRFSARVYHDSDMGTPWEEHDGHGPVSDWTRREKRPGERVLCEDRHARRYYDVAEATRIAKRDGWGMREEWRAEFEKRHGRKPTRGEVCAAAVAEDFDRLRRWCNDDWHWCGVGVVRDDGHDYDDSDYYINALWGTESDAGEYLRELAAELAQQIISTRRENWRAAMREARERRAWAQRDVVTK